MYSDSWLPIVIAGGVVAAAAPVLVRPLLFRYALFDVPSERSSHDRPTLRAGGVAPFLAVAVAALTLLALRDPVMAEGWAGVILGAGLAAGLVGLWDDLLRGRGLGVAVRAGCQLLIGAVAGACLAGISGAPWWAAGVAAFFVAAYINMTNFMDGIDGMSSLYGLVAGLTQFAIGSLSSLPWLQATGLLVAVSFVVFLPWNTLGARMFLGDVGSYLLGAMVSVGVVGSVFAGVPLIVAVSPTLIYLADTLTILLRRAARGEPVLRAHRSHVYQRLTQTGLSHLQVSGLVAVFSAGTAGVGLLVLSVGLNPLVAVGLAALLCAVYLSLPRWRGDRLPAPPVLKLKEIEPPPPMPPRSSLNPARWVVLGASGFVGSALVRSLEARGADVTRQPAPRLQLAPTDDPRQVIEQAKSHGDLTALAAALSGADIVINAAGLATPDAAANVDLYGANALLPAVIATAARAAGVTRVIHLSSAAVQGHRPTVDESLDVSPFSPYSHSKALGERAFLASDAGSGVDLLVIRATSVQGPGRPTTESFRRIARSPLASVAAPGTQPTVVSSIDGLVDFVVRVSRCTESIGPVLLQPWEGYSVEQVLRAAGGNPRRLPRWFCQAVLGLTRAVGRVVPEVAGAGRRLEMMWLGQAQVTAHQEIFPAVAPSCLLSMLSQARSEV